MPRKSLPSRDLPIQEKVLLARGGSLHSRGTRPDILIALASDANEEVREAAQQTLARLPDEEYLPLLAAPQVEEFVAAYLLDPSHLRLSLLPRLLTAPGIPVEAMAALASQAGPEQVAVLLANLQLLPTSVLMALRSNPAYLDGQKRAAAVSSGVVQERSSADLPEKEKQQGQQQLAQMILLANSTDEEVRRGAAETLRGISDEELLDLMAVTSLEEAVARYFLDAGNIRPALLPLLLGHPDSPQDSILSLCATAGAEAVPTLLDQLDLLSTRALIALRDNPTYLLWQKEPPPQGYVIEVDLLDLLIQEMQSDREISAEQIKEALVGVEDAREAGSGSLTNKIARMKVAQRVKLALLGTREERALLIRDPSRVVWRAVLGSPKLTEAEIETFSALKNVSQELLRSIAMNRNFMKHYVVLKNLAMNPRTSIDVALPLLNRLLPNDLRAAAASKDIPDTTRKMAQKLIRGRSG